MADLGQPEPVNQPVIPSPPPPSGPPQLEKPKWRWRWMWLALLIVFLGFSYWYDQSLELATQTAAPTGGSSTPSPASPNPTTIPNSTATAPTVPAVITAAQTPAKTVVEAGAFKLVADSASNCTVEKPEGWAKPIAGEGSKTLDVFSVDKSMYAGYGIQAVNTQLAAFASYYGPPLNDPDLYSNDPATVTLAYAKLIIKGIGGDTDAAYTDDDNQTIGEYSFKSIASSTHRGVLFFHTAGFPGDGYNYTYALPMYFAITKNTWWDHYGLMVAKVAGSIRCSATVVVHDSGPDIGSSSNSSSKSDENGSDAGYNPQLGTEEVHDPTTGENYVVSPSQHWSETGPNGPGYYIPKSGGNDYVHLEPGRSD